jgi:hypothetical protein
MSRVSTFCSGRARGKRVSLQGKAQGWLVERGHLVAGEDRFPDLPVGDGEPTEENADVVGSLDVDDRNLALGVLGLFLLTFAVIRERERGW